MATSLNTIDASFEQAVEKLRNTRMVACVEAYPVLPERMASNQTKQYFANHPHEFITNDGRAIYYSQENILNISRDLNISVSSYDLQDYLTREYGHLFLQHSRLRRYYDKDELKANTFAVACEIEACRLQGISHQRVCYQTSATDEIFPCTREAKYLLDIYHALIDEYGDGIEQAATGGQNGDDQNDGDDKNPQHSSSKDCDKGDDQSDDDQGEKGKKQLTKNQLKKVQGAANRQKQKPSPVDGDDQMLQAYDYDPTPAETEERPINELIGLTYQRWQDKQVRHQLRKLKATVAGQVSKKNHATYARPSRRAITSNGLLTKGRKKDLAGQPTILVALDASGSMDAQRVKDLTSCIGNIFDDLGRPKKGCYICMFESDIVEYKPMRQWREVVEKYDTYGGTNYHSVIKLANQLNVDVVIEVGDGEGRCSDNSRRSPELSNFMARGAKWYDLLVLHDEGDLEYTWGSHICYDRNTTGLERTPICIDKKLSRILNAKETARKNS